MDATLALNWRTEKNPQDMCWIRSGTYQTQVTSVPTWAGGSVNVTC